jgi:hypothetical protein
VRKTIRSAQFMYFLPTGVERLNRKTGQTEEVLSVRHAFYGDTVDIPREEDIATGEAAGAFEPDEVEQESPAVEQQPPADPDEPDFTSHDALVAWYRHTKPTASRVVAAADGDPTKAAALQRAEHEATGGQPRKAVTRGLAPLLEEEEEEEDE